MKFQSIVYTVLSTTLTATSVRALPNKADLPARTTPSLDAPLAPSWYVVGKCMILDDATDLNGVQNYVEYNTPEACTKYCESKPDYPPYYTYAAVGGSPYGCYCGYESDYKATDAKPAYYDDECNTPCPGDYNLACGAKDRVQVYARPPPPPPVYPRTTPPTPKLPYGWKVVSACSDDANHYGLEGDYLVTLDDNTPYKCSSLCESTTYYEDGVYKTYTYSGVENGNECHCGKGWKGGADVDVYQCSTPCPGDATEYCGAYYKIQVYTKEY